MYFGRLFHIIWNAVPVELEHGWSLVLTRRELKKLTTRAYWVGNEMWRLGVGRMNWLAVIGRGMNRLDGAKLVPNVT